MFRPIIYSLEQIRSFDTAWGWKDTMYGLAGMVRLFLGNQNTVLDNFIATQSSPLSLVVQVTDGAIYQLAAADATPYGPLPSDNTQIMQQGYASAGTVTMSTSGLSAGQSKWGLLEVAFVQVDAIRTGDPNSGVLPYVNVNNPGQPLQGPNGSGVAQNTVRQGVAQFSVIYGASATSGSEVPPSPSFGFVPAYLINITFGQATISNGQILVAGNSAYSGYQQAPFCPGLTGTVVATPGGSHHGGINGQAAKILITNSAEIQGLMGFANLPVTNASPPTVSGIVTFAGEIPIESQGNGSPSGALAGMRGDQYIDLVQGVLWVCTASGSSSTAVWLQIGAGGVSQYINTTPFIPSAGNVTYLVDTSGGNITANFQFAAGMAGTSVGLINLGGNQIIMQPKSTEFLTGPNGLPLSVNTPRISQIQGESFRWWPRTTFGYYQGG